MIMLHNFRVQRAVSFRRPRTWVLSLASVLPLLACQKDSLKPAPPADDRDLYWDLELSHHTVMLSTTAPYDTFRVVATPQNYLAEPLTELPRPEYRTTDIEKVVVTDDGLLIGVQATSTPVWIHATLTVDNLKHRDSMGVIVVNNPTPPVMASLSAHPVPPDSAKFGLGTSKTLSIQALDTLGNLIPNVIVHIRSSDPKIVRRQNEAGLTVAQLSGVLPGSATLFVSATVFGVTMEDQVPIQVGAPLYHDVIIEGDPASGYPLGHVYNSNVLIGTGGTVGWRFTNNNTLVPGRMLEVVDFIFDDDDLPNVIAPGFTDPWLQIQIPSPVYCLFFFSFVSCSPGNVVLGGGPVASDPFQSGAPITAAFRKFSAPGIYEYRSPLRGTRGRVVVVDD